MKKLSALLISLLVLVCSAADAFADGDTASLTLRPQQPQTETGQKITMQLTVEQCSHPLIGCLLYLELAEGYQLDAIRSGADIETSELSYSCDGAQLILMYLDNEVGSSPAPSGAVLAEIVLAAAKPGEGAPLRCTETDVVGGSTGGNVQLETSVSVGSVQVTGQPVDQPVQQPFYVEAGGDKQPLQEQPSAGAGSAGTAQGDPAASSEDTGTQSVPSANFGSAGAQSGSAVPEEPPAGDSRAANAPAAAPADSGPAEQTPDADGQAAHTAPWPWIAGGGLLALAAAAAAAVYGKTRRARKDTPRPPKP